MYHSTTRIVLNVRLLLTLCAPCVFRQVDVDRNCNNPQYQMLDKSTGEYQKQREMSIYFEVCLISVSYTHILSGTVCSVCYCPLLFHRSTAPTRR